MVTSYVHKKPMVTNVMCGAMVTGVWKGIYLSMVKMQEWWWKWWVMRDFRAALNGFIVKHDKFVVIFIAGAFRISLVVG